MCLIALAWQVSARFPLIIVANRDEAHARPSLPLQQWNDAPDVFGGRDLQEGGSWMALSRSGRLAAVTNVREPPRGTQPGSRGHLVRDFMMGGADANTASLRVTEHGNEYRPFNLILWDGRDMMHATNRPRPGCSVLRPGVHGISNGPVDVPWPKVRWITSSLQDWIVSLPDGHGQGNGDADAEPDVTLLFAALASERRALYEDLPQTGVGAELEHRLSATFIRDGIYGTRASTVLLVDRAGQATVIERSFGSGGTVLGEHRVRVQLRPQ